MWFLDKNYQQFISKAVKMIYSNNLAVPALKTTIV